MDEATRTELEAAAFRRLRQHLMEDRPDVQNIDLMNLAGFCRNCLSRWYQEAAAERGIDMDKDAARAIFYGMPYEDWKAAQPDRGKPRKAGRVPRRLRAQRGRGQGLTRARARSGPVVLGGPDHHVGGDRVDMRQGAQHIGVEPL